jgi:hypothetical protein
LRKPSLARVQAAAVLLRHGFTVGRGRSHSAGDGIEEHELQEADGSADL